MGYRGRGTSKRVETGGNHQRFFKNIQQSKEGYREEAKKRQWKLGGLDSHLPSPDQKRTTMTSWLTIM